MAKQKIYSFANLSPKKKVRRIGVKIFLTKEEWDLLYKFLMENGYKYQFPKICDMLLELTQQVNKVKR